MRIAIIPARGGSKRIPGKNVKMFGGRPMIAWSIEAAIESDCFDRVIVSTDDEHIAEIANQAGAEIPFMRPPELSDDYTPTIPVIAHAVNWQNQYEKVDVACCIYATAPFINVADIQCGLRRLVEEGSDYAFSVTRYAFPIQRALKLSESERVSMFFPENITTRSQDVADAFHDAGQFYWGTAEAWIAERPIMSAASIGIILPRIRVQDIDTIEDWRYAEQLWRVQQYSRNADQEKIYD